MFIEIFSKWSESLSFFKKESLKSFFLASLNNAFNAIVLLFKKFWFHFLFTFIFWVSLYFWGFTSSFIEDLKIRMILNYIIGLPFYISLFLVIFSFFILPFLLTRASSQNKNFDYFKRMFNKSWGILILIFSMFILPMLIIGISNFVVLSLCTKFFIAFWSTIFLFTVFFYLDEKTYFVSLFRSFFKALKVAIYFLPVLTFLSFIFWTLTSISELIRHLSYMFIFENQYIYLTLLIISMILGFIFYFLNLSFVSNYYNILRYKYYKFFYE